VMETKFDTTIPHGDPRLTITLVGHHDLFRFAVNMLDDQCEFAEAGRKSLAQLRDHVGPDRFDPWARNMLGDDRYNRLSGYRSFEHPEEDL